ncbi:MAG: PfkB family carbohydrate kinase [Pseudomonadota bacterium]
MAQILVVGSAVLDFVFSMEELPEKAEKHRANAMQIVGGGCAANASVAIARLGGQAQLLARFGRDEIYDLVAEDLAKEGVDLTLLDVAENGRSAVSSVYVDGSGERQIMAFRGEGLAEYPRALGQLSQDAILADTRWPHASAMAFEGFDGIRVLDGEAPVPQSLAQTASHVVFSEQGLASFSGIASYPEALLKVSEQIGGWVAVTLGAHGVAWVESGEIRNMAGFQVDVEDTLGAGDVWHGAFTLRLAEGASEADAMIFANAAAALKCKGLGGRKATPDRSTVELFLKENT